MISVYASTVIPYHGAWLEYETDANDVFNVRIDKNRKLPITWFLKAMGAYVRACCAGPQRRFPDNAYRCRS